MLMRAASLIKSYEFNCTKRLVFEPRDRQDQVILEAFILPDLRDMFNATHIFKDKYHDYLKEKIDLRKNEYNQLEILS